MDEARMFEMLKAFAGVVADHFELDAVTWFMYEAGFSDEEIEKLGYDA